MIKAANAKEILDNKPKDKDLALFDVALAGLFFEKKLRRF